jgi:hypothetical protein
MTSTCDLQTVLLRRVLALVAEERMTRAEICTIAPLVLTLIIIGLAWIMERQNLRQ